MGTVISQNLLFDLSEVWRGTKKPLRVAFTNGCFDLFHAGHLATIQMAKAYAERVIVGVNTDLSVWRLKGSPRPYIPFKHRAQIVASIEGVSHVVPITEDTLLEIIKKLRPTVLVKGEEYSARDIVGAKEVAEYGGKIVRVVMLEGISTSSIVGRIKRNES